MTSGTAGLNILYDNQQRMYNVIFAELSWNVWDKRTGDDGITKFSQILGQFVVKFAGDYFEFDAWRDGRQSKLQAPSWNVINAKYC